MSKHPKQRCHVVQRGHCQFHPERGSQTQNSIEADIWATDQGESDCGNGNRYVFFEQQMNGREDQKQPRPKDAWSDFRRIWVQLECGRQTFALCLDT